MRGRRLLRRARFRSGGCVGRVHGCRRVNRGRCLRMRIGGTGEVGPTGGRARRRDRGRHRGARRQRTRLRLNCGDRTSGLRDLRRRLDATRRSRSRSGRRRSSRRRRRRSGLSANGRGLGGGNGRRRRRRNRSRGRDRDGRRNDCRFPSPSRRDCRLRRRRIDFSTRRERSVDLRLDEHVVRAADHDQMFDVVAPDEDELPLAVETESVHEAQPRLPRPPPRDPQPVRERQAINDRQRHQNGYPASHQNADLGNRVAGERKVIQPLHAISKSPRRRRRRPQLAPSRADGQMRVVNTLARVRSSVDSANPRRSRRIGVIPIAAQDKPSRFHNKTQSR